MSSVPFPPMSPREGERLSALRRYDLPGTSPRESLRGLLALAAQICGTPAAMVSLVDDTCQWAFDSVGAAVTNVPRELSFCAHAITQEGLFEIPDARVDSRFAENPYVTGYPGTCFYAGVPLVTPDGYPLGTLCVSDTVPRELRHHQRDALECLAEQVVEHLELHLFATRLQDQAELLRLATDAVIVVNGTGEVVFWNRGAEELYGWSAGEVEGACLGNVVPTHGGDEPAYRRRVLIEQGSWEGELQQVTKFGRRVVVRNRSVMRVDSHGQPRAILEINTDVTAERASANERERLLRLLQEQNTQLRTLDRVKDDFLASISHEVRTPLSSIHAYLDYLCDGDIGPLTPEQEQCLEVVRRNSERVLRLVDNLLSAGREAGRLRLNLAVMDMAEVAAECIEALRPMAQERDLTVELRRSGTTLVDGDRDRLTEVLDNLLSNALKFTPAAGSIRVVVGGDESAVRLKVEDSGIGVPAAERRSLFDRFFRGSVARDLAIPGVGLGLTICTTIVEAHGGRLGMEPIAEGGSAFWIELPTSSRDEVGNS